MNIGDGGVVCVECKIRNQMQAIEHTLYFYLEAFVKLEPFVTFWLRSFSSPRSS